ncbi:NAD(P)/FAD-dependent oxidoreductase [bacterium]|nr:NAD(P)/FAD-dependent oxidoreductase [bacterium]
MRVSASSSFDAIIVGGGHNGLVAAGYLARAGKKVLVLERRDIVGGACVTEEIFPGYKISTAAYVNSLLRPEIIRDFGLEARGYELLRRDPSSFSPLADGRYQMFWADAKKTHAEIAKFSTRDADRYADYEAELERVAALMEPMLMAPAPDPLSRSLGDLWNLAKMALRWRPEVDTILRLFSMSAADYIERWFESEPLKARLATDGVIGAWAGPRTPGTAYVLFHHVMGQAHGQRGVWGYVRGGMGTITAGLADYVREKRGTILTEAAVARIDIKQEKVTGVTLADGRSFQAPVVLSNLDPKQTFLKLIEPTHVSNELRRDVDNVRCRSGVVKINVATNGVPNFTSLPSNGPGPQHRGTIHFVESIDEIDAAFDDARAGRPSTRPVVEMCIPSVVDPTLAPPGKHFVSLFVQYAPYQRSDGLVWNKEAKDEFARRAFAMIAEKAPNWNDIVDDYMVLTPVDLEERFGMTGGNIFHGEMTLDQLAFLRPSRSLNRYRTPITGLYLCGSAVHPGGGVMGAPGFLAAREVLGRRA